MLAVIKSDEIKTTCGMLYDGEQFLFSDQDKVECAHCGERDNNSYREIDEDGLVSNKSYCTIDCLEFTREVARQMDKDN